MATHSLASLKKDKFDDAASVSIPIKEENGRIIGQLIPVGDWALSDPMIINAMTHWRSRFKKMFPTQSHVTYESTVAYLKKSSIDHSTSVLFLIYDDTHQCIGHIGVAHVDQSPFELVNLMRGTSGGHPRLVYYAEITLIDYFFKHSNADSSDVEVMSYNWMVISLHEEVGYTLVESFPLKKLEGDFGIKHEIVATTDSNVTYSIQKLVLKKQRFYELASFLT